jgi:PKD repeat protein
VSVDIVPGEPSISPGATRTFEVKVSGVDDGVGSGDFDIRLTDPEVAAFTSASVRGDPGFGGSPEVSADSIEFAYLSADTTDRGTIVIANITVKATRRGSTDVVFDPAATDTINSERGTNYRIRNIDGASMTVSTAPIVDDDPVSDVDGDGQYEDINGDGVFSVLDVSLFLNEYDSSTVTANRARFDYNGDGLITIRDVSALLREL